MRVKHAALIIVDLQPDFMPGGALAVQEGDVVVDPVRRLMETDRFGLYVATQDWHPRGHVSFASSHPGKRPLDVIELYGHEQVLWPDHCVRGTPGAELARGLPWEKVSVIIRKANDPRVDSYSTFRNNWDPEGHRPPTGLAGYLHERGLRDLWICGLARDYCVRWSAEDAVREGFTVHVIWDLTRPVDPGSDAAVRGALDAAGVDIIDSAALLGSRV
jgi:nicotinamidase/pyrazinamidase